MQLSDILSKSRIYLAEPDNTGRWSDNDLTSLANTASVAVARAVDFPEGHIDTTTTPNTGEYPLPQILKILRVYVAGMRCLPTKISELEGDQIGFYDASGKAGVPQRLDTSVNTISYPPTSFPQGSQQPSLPFFPGRRPSYYLRGGNLGLTPIPTNAVSLSVDIIPTPAKLVNATDNSTLPDDFLEAVAWKIVEQAKVADANSSGGSMDLANAARERYESEIRNIMMQLRTRQGDKDERPIVMSYRSAFRGPFNGND